jgi:GAF domain-containing protein
MPRAKLVTSDFADRLVPNFDVVELLTLLTDCCVEVLGVGAAGIMLMGPHHELRVMASSSEAMRVLELFEVQSHEGPCLECYHTGRPVLNLNLAAGDRWPRFTTEALDAGFLSVHALPLRMGGKVIGALNLFDRQPDAMPQSHVYIAQALADMATIAILQHRATLEAQNLNAQLQHAINSRAAIEQAKGVIAENKGIGMDEAFNALRNFARSHRLRVAEIAQDITNGSFDLSKLESAPNRNL